MSPVRTAVLAVCLWVFSGRVSAQENPPLPEGNAYMRAVLTGTRPQDAAINDYSYDTEEARENIGGDGRPSSRETRRYQVYFVKTRPVRRLVSRNGIPLSAKEQAEVDRKAEALAGAIAEGRTVSERPGIRLGSLLDSFEFKTRSREDHEGRSTLILDFEPRKGGPASAPAEGAANAVTKILAGRILIDEADRRVVRFEARNTPGAKASVATGVKLGAIDMIMDYVRVEDGVWLPKNVVTFASGRAFFFKTFRVRRTTTYSNYRRFRVDTEERPVG